MRSRVLPALAALAALAGCGGFGADDRVVVDLACPDTGDEIITIHPPTGKAPVPFDDLIAGFDARPHSAVFLRRGRFVACGSV
jgi:hypothetical protein